MLDASCRDVDPELFFATSKDPKSLAQTATAVAICGVCSVRTACLTMAIVTDARYGVWGGMIPVERDRVRRKLYRNSLHRERAAAGTGHGSQFRYG